VSDFKIYPSGPDEGSSNERFFYSSIEQRTKKPSTSGNQLANKSKTKKQAKTDAGKTATVNEVALNHRISMCCVVFGYEEDELKVLLLETDNNMGVGLTLPGCLAADNQTLEGLARQMVSDLSGAEKFFLEQVYSFGMPPKPGAATSEEMRADAWEITVAFFALLNADSTAANPAFSSQKAKWYSLTEVSGLSLHQKRIVDKALDTLRFEIRYFPIAFELLPEKFTLTQVQSLYEAISGKKLDKRNFRKKVKALNLIAPAGEKQKNNIARPSELFVFNRDFYSDSPNSIL